MKKERGITLIALIITIIILIILAMVTVKIVTDSNIVYHAENATKTYSVEQEKELIGVAYTGYKAQTYGSSIIPVETTEDLDSLEKYFLGEDKQGLTEEDFQKLVVKEPTTTIEFTNGVIIELKEENIEAIGENEGAYLFNYNGYRYRLVLDISTAGTIRVEVVGKLAETPTLNIEDATIEDENVEWVVTFNGSNNKYYISKKDGAISNTTTKWWVLTEEEEKAIFTDENFDGSLEDIGFGDLYKVAISNNDKGAVYITKTNRTILVSDGNDTLLMFPTISEIPENDLFEGIEKTQIWYKFELKSTGSTSFEIDWNPYTGKCPIAVENFDEIVSQTFLERIINNF